MFTQFITDRLLKPDQDPEILVFDEYIKLKLNRSRLKLVKDDTPFLNVSLIYVFTNMIFIHVYRMILLESRKSFGQLHPQMKLTQRDMKGSPFISPLTSNPVLYIVFFFCNI